MKMKAIIPKRLLFDVSKLSRAIDNTLDSAAKAVQVDFEVTTQTWTNKPDFVIDEAPGKRTVYTADEIYHYVNDGTRPHIIAAKNKKMLAFGVPHGAKTTPKVIGSGSGSKGSTMVFKKQVKHPGTQAREFTTVIADKWQKELPRLLQRAIDSEV